MTTSLATLRVRRAVAVAIFAAVAVAISTAAAVRAQPLPQGETAADTEAASTDTGTDDDIWVAARASVIRPAPEPEEEASTPRVLARYDGVDLVEPADQALAIGFHQAGGNHPAMTPVGDLVANENPGGTEAVDDDRKGPEIRVMPSRGRGGSATGAVDIALAPGETVRSLVTGTVTAVNSYSLYGTHHDFLLEIQPEGRPDLRVMVFHVIDPRVSVGDAVYAGMTPIAESARPLPVRNQVDRYAGECPCPHIDVRIRRV